MTLDGTLAKLGEVRKSFRSILAVKGVTFERAEGLLGVPRRLSHGQIKLVDWNIPPRVACAVCPELPGLCRMEVWRPAQVFNVCV